MESNQESNEDLVICHGIHESTLHATSLSAHNDNNDTHNDITNDVSNGGIAASKVRTESFYP